jgi:hypothetical protein
MVTMLAVSVLQEHRAVRACQRGGPELSLHEDIRPSGTASGALIASAIFICFRGGSRQLRSHENNKRDSGDRSGILASVYAGAGSWNVIFPAAEFKPDKDARCAPEKPAMSLRGGHHAFAMVTDGNPPWPIPASFFLFWTSYL